MLGSVRRRRGSAVPDPGADGHLGIAEGIETALAAHAIFGVPTWAALSADGMARWQWPAEVKRVTIFADAGDAGRQAAATLADRLNVADIPSEIVCADPRRRLQRRPAARRGRGGLRAAVGRRPTSRRRLLTDVSAASTRTDVTGAGRPSCSAEAEALTNPPDVTALGMLLGRLVLARLEPLPERQVLARIKGRDRHRRRCSTGRSASCAAG